MKGDLSIDKFNELNFIAAIQPKINPGSNTDISHILFICKYSDPEAIYEDYDFTNDPIILIKLWSVIRQNEQEDNNRSFLSGLENFDIPKIVINHEEITFEIAYFDLKDHQDESLCRYLYKRKGVKYGNQKNSSKYQYRVSSYE